MTKWLLSNFWYLLNPQLQQSFTFCALIQANTSEDILANVLMNPACRIGSRCNPVSAARSWLYWCSWLSSSTCNTKEPTKWSQGSEVCLDSGGLWCHKGNIRQLIAPFVTISGRLLLLVSQYTGTYCYMCHNIRELIAPCVTISGKLLLHVSQYLGNYCYICHNIRTLIAPSMTISGNLLVNNQTRHIRTGGNTALE